jgi:hypothetical protein
MQPAAAAVTPPAEHAARRPAGAADAAAADACVRRMKGDEAMGSRFGVYGALSILLFQMIIVASCVSCSPDQETSVD